MTKQEIKVKTKAKKKPIWWEYRHLEQCPSCGVAIGGIEEHYIQDYREHKICLWCIAQWKCREQLAGHTLSYEEFIKGDVSK